MAKPKTKSLPSLRRILKPSDLTEKEEQSLVGAITIGVSRQDACWSIGLSFPVFSEWMSAPVPSAEVEAFRDKILQAEGKGVVYSHKVVWDGGAPARGRPAVAPKVLCDQHRWLLERRRPTKQDASPDHRGHEIPVDPDAFVQAIAILQSAGVSFPEELVEQMRGA